MSVTEKLQKDGDTFNKTHLPIREDWLRETEEEAIEPELEIVDPHHHLWGTPRPDYLLPELLADLQAGHRIISTVFVECRAMYRAHGPEERRSIGETEFVNGIAAMSASGAFGDTRIAEKIVGYVDLALGERARDILQEHVRVSSGRFAGVRNINAYHPDPNVISTSIQYPRDLMQDPSFHEGVRVLGELDLSFDAFMYHTQIRELATLAEACPQTRIVIDHYGCPVGIGPYRGKREEVFADWAESMTLLARYPNLTVKVGGLGLRTCGFGFNEAERAPSSDALAAAWQPYFDHTVEQFGAERCMFESNFPVDKGSCSYANLWNAFKKMSAGLAPQQRRDLFTGTASRVYRMAGAPSP